MNKKYWIKYYKDHFMDGESSFAHFCLPYLNGPFMELGCGNGRDLYFFFNKDKNGLGVDNAFDGMFVLQQDINTFIRQNHSYEHVYTRFLWHAIERELQLKILKWTKKWLYIEARTTEDMKLPKTFKHHKRNYVKKEQLLKDLTDNGFEIIKQEEGQGLSPMGDEDPYLIRIIAKKWTKKNK